MAQQVVTIDGIKYYTLLEGPPVTQDNLPILLVHALMSNHLMWDETVQFLHASGYSTLRFDHVGHSRTPAPDRSNASYHMDDITRHMAEIVKSVTGQARVRAVIGCSIGGVLALRYAMLFPQETEQIISIAAPGIAAPEKAKALWSQRIEQFEQDVKDGSDVLCQKTVERWFPGSGPDDIAVRQKSLLHVKTCSLTGYKILADTIRDYDYTDEVERVKARTLVIAGSVDGACSPEHLQGIAKQIEGARYVLMEGAGHIPPMHKAKEFNELIGPFLRGLN